MQQSHAAIIRAVADALSCLTVPIVLDPVMVAKSGDRLLHASAVAALRAALPMATVITPNLPEAADLLGVPEALSRPEMQAQAQALLAIGAQAVLLKGGHLPGDDCPDLLVRATGQTWLQGPREATRKTHGTAAPCRLRWQHSSATACPCPRRRRAPRPMSPAPLPRPTP